MGRRKKYFSEEERKQSNLDRVKKYYSENKKDIDKRAKEKYWKNKICELLKEGNMDEAKIAVLTAITRGYIQGTVDDVLNYQMEELQ